MTICLDISSLWRKTAVKHFLNVLQIIPKLSRNKTGIEQLLKTLDLESTALNQSQKIIKEL